MILPASKCSAGYSRIIMFFLCCSVLAACNDVSELNRAPSEKRTELPVVKTDSGDEVLLNAAVDASVRMIKVPGGTVVVQEVAYFGGSRRTFDVEIAIAEFMISETEVTVSQFRRFCEESSEQFPDQSEWRRNSHPVTNVSWDLARKYCDWSGMNLPSRAQFNHVKELGASVEIGASIREIAWLHDKNSPSSYDVQEVAQLNSDELGIFDVVGNVEEWLSEDVFPRRGISYGKGSGIRVGKRDSKFRRTAGGSCLLNPEELKSYSGHSSERTDSMNTMLGFRVVYNTESDLLSTKPTTKPVRK